MALIPWRPFQDLEKFFEGEWPEIWEWPEKWLSHSAFDKLIRTPRVDVYEEGNNVVAEFELPGVDPKNINVEVEKDMIKVEAKSEEEKKEKKKGYYKRELSRGYVKRVIPLPVEIDDSSAEAEYENGVLRVVAPKVEKKESKKKTVKVKVKKSSK